MNKSRALLAAGAFGLLPAVALAAGVVTNGLPQIPVIGTTANPGSYGQLMGNELLPVDTGLPSGQNPQSVAANPAEISTVAAAMVQHAATATAGAATDSFQTGIITSESLSTAVGGTYTLTLTNTMISATSQVYAAAFLGSSTVGRVQVQSVTPGSGSVVIVVKNVGTAALSGTIFVGFQVL